MNEGNSRVEKVEDISSFLDKLLYALETKAPISFQEERMVDQTRDVQYTNRFTVAELFPNEDPVKALRNELKKLTIKEYIKTVTDDKFPQRSEMRAFGRVYRIKGRNKDVYIKIRVELMNPEKGSFVFVMSFHYAEYPFSDKDFPYKNKKIIKYKIVVREYE